MCHAGLVVVPYGAASVVLADNADQDQAYCSLV